MIVKVQLSLATSFMKQQVLIYNKDRSVSYQADATEDIKAVMGDARKAFFHAAVGKDGKLELRKRVAKELAW